MHTKAPGRLSQAITLLSLCVFLSFLPPPSIFCLEARCQRVYVLVSSLYLLLSLISAKFIIVCLEQATHTHTQLLTCTHTQNTPVVLKFCLGILWVLSPCIPQPDPWCLLAYLLPQSSPSLPLASLAFL